MNTLRKFMSRLREVERVGELSDASWTARCPAHEDALPSSLSFFTTPKGGFIVICERGCYPNLVMEAVGMADEDRQGSPENLPPVHIEKFERTERGNGQRFEYYHGQQVRYIVEEDEWATWDGLRWRRDTKGVEMMRRYEDVLQKIQEEKKLAIDAKEANYFESFHRSTAKVSGITNMLKMARQRGEIPVSTSELDGAATSYRLVASNGVIDLHTGKLTKPDPKLLITHAAGVEYDPEAKCPRWERFLHEIRDGNDDEVKFLQRWFGYALTAETHEHKLCIFQGGGSNGKGALAHTVEQLLGSYAESTSAQTFDKSRSSKIREDLAMLHRARLVVASEPDADMVVDEAIVKQLAGEDPIHCEFKFQSMFRYLPQFKVTILTNPLPKIRGTDHGIWRRIIFVPFLKTFPESAKLKYELAEERPGILRWLVEGCLDWQRHGLQIPESIRAATQNYRNGQDPLAGFLEDCCLLKEAFPLPERWLFQIYKKWSEDTRETGFRDIRKFRAALAGRRGIKITADGGRNLIHGVIIKAHAAQEVPGLPEKDRLELERFGREHGREPAPERELAGVDPDIRF